MSAPRDDDREAIDRAFAELVAGYHLTADRADPLLPRQLERDSALPASPTGPHQGGPNPTGPNTTGPAPTGSNPAGPNPTGSSSVGAEPPSAGAPTPNPLPSTTWADNHPLFVNPKPSPVAPDPEPDERYVPDPQPPLARPRLPILLAWVGIAYAAIVVLLAAFGLSLPSWMGWLALAGFLGGFGVLVFNLPRSRPPDDDGAVL
jgi:hypothetical protein